MASYTAILTRGLQQLGAPVREQATFDTVSLKTDGATKTIAARAVSMGANLRIYFESWLCISLDETTTRADIELLWKIFAKDGQATPSFDAFEGGVEPLIPPALRRSSTFLTHPVFNTHHSVTPAEAAALNDMLGRCAPTP